jgi:thioredoxin-related protein
MKRIFLLVSVIATLIGLSAMNPAVPQPTEESPVNWMTFEEAVEKSKTEKRKIFIDVYTDWCGFCKVMDRGTFSDPHVAKILNEKYYPVKFNAEQSGDVVFRGTTFKYVGPPEGGRGGVHQLAAALLQNKLSYPTVVFLNEDFNMLLPWPGARNAKEFHMMATFIAGDHFKTQKYEQWQTSYKSPF